MKHDCVNIYPNSKGSLVSVGYKTEKGLIAMIKKMNLFVRIITFGWARAITLYPFGIYIREEWIDDRNVIRHEIGHWFQQVSLGYIFYPFYLIEWIVKLFIYGREAYKNLSFEREARENYTDWNYWINRKPFDWIKYI